MNLWRTIDAKDAKIGLIWKIPKKECKLFLVTITSIYIEPIANSMRITYSTLDGIESKRLLKSTKIVVSSEICKFMDYPIRRTDWLYPTIRNIERDFCNRQMDAFLMGRHKRVGVDSPLRGNGIDSGLRDDITHVIYAICTRMPVSFDIQNRIMVDPIIFGVDETGADLSLPTLPYRCIMRIAELLRDSTRLVDITYLQTENGIQYPVYIVSYNAQNRKLETIWTI